MIALQSPTSLNVPLVITALMVLEHPRLALPEHSLLLWRTARLAIVEIVLQDGIVLAQGCQPQLTSALLIFTVRVDKILQHLLNMFAQKVIIARGEQRFLRGVRMEHIRMRKARVSVRTVQLDFIVTQLVLQWSHPLPVRRDTTVLTKLPATGISHVQNVSITFKLWNLNGG